MKQILSLSISLLVAIATLSAQNNIDTKQMNRFIDQLMAKMTLQEKIGQLNLVEGEDVVSGGKEKAEYVQMVKQGMAGAMLDIMDVKKIYAVQRMAVEESRLHIPLFFGLDVIHGYSTVFPIPLGLSCSWDMKAIERSARIAATEATSEGICWNFSPMVDICHDARWGRIAEGSGEDPYLGSQIAAAMVRGYQGTDLAADNTMMACVKHFGMYGASDGGQDYNIADMSRWRMYNEYLPPYRAAIEAGAFSVMSSFNVVDGIPATGNRWLLTDLLRGQWHFPGFVVSDYESITDMTNHSIGDSLDCATASLNAGLDLDMCSYVYIRKAEQLLREGRISMKTINQSVRRILEAKYRLGLFDDPYRYCRDTLRRDSIILCPEHRAEARRIASETFVLLKNHDKILPLKKQGKIALIGPMANDRLNISGTWSWCAQPDRYLTLLEGMRNAVGSQAEILYARGCNLMYDAAMEDRLVRRKKLRDPRPDDQLLREALQVAQKADVIVCAMGECSEMSGEAASMVHIEIPDAQRDLLQALAKTGKPIVLLNFSGRPMVLNWENDHLDAILQVWFAGSETADAIADVLFGAVSPSGKLTTTFPHHVGQYPMTYARYASGRPMGERFQRFKTNYLDVPVEGLFPFGYGLSYTSFHYSPITLSDTTLNSRSSITATVTITNTGNFDADEIVQLYIRDISGSVVRPIKELKGFQRLTLRKGESRQVQFTIDEPMLRFYNKDLVYTSEPGAFTLMIGPNSRDLQSRSFTLKAN
ncbi:MAG: beta-glucosidase BglX [Bacteroidales bacterium]|nr:beta-glucosidase BglX [Bacteroidales bacterium]